MAKKKLEEQSDCGEEDYEDQPNFDDPEGFVDNVTDEELFGDLLKQKPCETDGVENVVVVDNIPKVATARQEKLKTVLEKLFLAYGEIVNVFFPVDEEGITKGYAFLEYKNSENAEQAVKNLHNHRLDKSHMFAVNLFTDFQKYENIPIEWETPQPQPYKVQPDLYSFLTEPDACDQYCVAAETAPNSVQVQFWQNTLPEPNELETRDRFTETFVKWSPLGTYIVTFHKPGVILWGCSNFTRVHKFPHTGTQFVDFSPCENYLITYGPGNSSSGQKIIIWDIRTGLEKRSFLSDGSSNMSMFRWSHDDKYVSTLGEGAICIYETPTFYLLNKKSIKVPGIRSFCWSPTDNIIAFWVAEATEVPAKVTLMEIPKKRDIRTKNLFNVADCKIHWQKKWRLFMCKSRSFRKIKEGQERF